MLRLIEPMPPTVTLDRYLGIWLVATHMPSPALLKRSDDASSRQAGIDLNGQNLAVEFVDNV